MKTRYFRILSVGLVALAACGGAPPAGGGSGAREGGAGEMGTGGTAGIGGDGETGGTVGIAGTVGTAGTVGSPPAGAGGASGASGGAGGSAGTTSGSGGAGGSVSTAMQAAAVLDGQEWLMPCGRGNAYTNLGCLTPSPDPGACSSDPTLPYYLTGKRFRDDRIVFGGTPGKTYDVTLRIRGVVEPRHFANGMKDVAHDGWYVGGEPLHVGTYNIYMLWISTPTVLPSALGAGQFFFLNAVDHVEAHFTYPIDYTVTISIAAGSDIWFLLDDANCLNIRNCDSTSIDSVTMGTCTPSVIPDLPASAGIAQPYDGQFIYMNVVSAAER